MRLYARTSLRTLSRLRLAGPVLALIAALLPGLAPAQATPTLGSGPAPSRLDLYGGYGYFRPFSSDIGNIPYQTINVGGVFSVAGYFNRHLGLQLEGNFFPQGSDDHDCVYSAQAGPILRVQKGRFVPFVHALGGAARVGGPAAQPCNVWGWGVTGGGGLDYILPVLHDHIALRPIQADFSYSQIDNGPPAGELGGLGQIYALRLSAGAVFRLGGQSAKLEDTTLNCSADPATVYAGDPITMSASAINLRDARGIQYTWMTSGGRISGTDATEPLDTAGLAPGTYTVTGRLLDRKSRQIASCTAGFTVQSPAPPTLTCSADRAAINSGDPVTITSVGQSPQGRPLTYTYSTSAGQITGSGPTASLNTAGTTPGTITVTCTAADDKGRTASATTSVVVATPAPPAPAATAQTLCSLSFERDRRRPDRVDNESKACLDDIALNLNRDPGARLLIVGHNAPGEPVQAAAARTLNVRQYLTDEKGIDPARLDLRTSTASGRTVDDMLLPAGTTVDDTSMATFNPSAIHRTGQPYGRPGAPRLAHHRTRRRRHRTTSTAATPPQ